MASTSALLTILTLLLPPLGHASVAQPLCLERIWPEFQRCRERQIDNHRYGRYASSIGWHLASTDVYQPKYKLECCSYWDLMECVHRAAKAYCNDEVSLLKLDKSLEMLGLNIPVYICLEEYPKGSLRCRLPWWLIVMSILGLFLGFLLVVVVFVCVKGDKKERTRDRKDRR